MKLLIQAMSTEAFFEDVVRPFLAFLNEDTYQVHKTTSEKTITELGDSIFLPQARAGVPQIIILLAGDGAIVDLVNVFQPCLMSDQENECSCKVSHARLRVIGIETLRRIPTE